MRLSLLALVLLLSAGWGHAAQETPSAPETDQSTSAGESDGIIPPDTQTLLSTQTVTPTSVFPEKKPYDQAKDELIHALELWNAGHFEAASDTALQAYDDLVDLHRVPGVKRSKIRAQVRQAATLYTDAGIAYIKNFVQQAGYTQAAIDEGRARLEDLRDVAKNYNDLNKKLDSAIERIATPPAAK